MQNEIQNYPLEKYWKTAKFFLQKKSSTNIEAQGIPTYLHQISSRTSPTRLPDFTNQAPQLHLSDGMKNPLKKSPTKLQNKSQVDTTTEQPAIHLA